MKNNELAIQTVIMATQRDYDVIVVGGRVAGATLAAYLGKASIRTLILEQDNFPADKPSPTPLVQPITLSLLDEIGAVEAQYASETPRLKYIALFEGSSPWTTQLPNIAGRDFAYAIDRSRFDEHLWHTAVSYASVEGIQGFKVDNLLWDNTGKAVIGVSGTHGGSEQSEQFTAKLVVGADGRFSMVARKVEARVKAQHTEAINTAYYARWEGTTRLLGDGQAAPTASVYTSKTQSYSYLLMDGADEQTSVILEGPAEVMETGNETDEGFYLRKLAENRSVWARLSEARMTSNVNRIDKIRTMFREAGGKGWALVGDAYHQKDPVDGQSLYDTVYTSRTLARMIN